MAGSPHSRLKVGQRKEVFFSKRAKRAKGSSGQWTEVLPRCTAMQRKNYCKSRIIGDGGKGRGQDGGHFLVTVVTGLPVTYLELASVGHNS